MTADKILTLLENSKFSVENDLNTLNGALDLLFQRSQNIWKKGARERAFLLELLAGKAALSREAWQKSQGLTEPVCFAQGCMLLALSLLNGIGRSPVNAQKTARGYKIKALGKPQPIDLTAGVFDAESEKLVREFKQSFFGRASEASFGKNDLAVIKEAFKETTARLKNEQSFIKKIAKDPLQIFADQTAEQFFVNGLFIIVSALPAETLNTLLLHVGSYLPGELEEKTEEHLSVNARAYLTTSTQDLPELFNKVRFLLKLYSGRQRQIISIIIREKLQDFFKQLLASTEVKKQTQEHLRATAQDQYALRIKVLDNLVKLL